MSDGSDSKSDHERQLRSGGLVEAVAAAAVAALGFYNVLDKGETDAQIGLILIGLAMLFWLLRGRTLGKFALGKDGISAEFSDKIEAALEKAEEAKQIAVQQIAPAGGTQRSDEALRAAGTALQPADGWEHPRLERSKAPDNDPQKGQWGGKDTRNGRRLSASVEPAGDDLYEVVLTVEPVGNAPPIEGDVRFHLHDTFPRAVRTVKPVNGRARLSLVAWGAFTAGAEIKGEPDSVLELDLSDERYGYPKRFRSR
jgi:hypothetical protein